MENSNNKHIDQFSLVSFVAVLLEYRRIILIGTILTPIVSVLVFFCAHGFSFDSEDVRITYNLRISELPSEISDNIYGYSKSHSNADLVYQELNNLPFISKAMRDCPLASSLVDGADFNNNLASFVDHKHYEVVQSSLMNSIDISLNLNKNYVSNSEAFVNNLVRDLDSTLHQILVPQIQICKTNTDMTIDKISSNLSAKSDMAEYNSLQKTSVLIDNYLKSDIKFVESSLSFVTQKSVSVIRLLLISAFCGLFFFVIVAFVLDYISNILNDEEQMNTLRSAWNHKRS